MDDQFYCLGFLVARAYMASKPGSYSGFRWSAWDIAREDEENQ